MKPLAEKNISELVNLYLKDFVCPKADFEEVITRHRRTKIRKADTPGYFSGNTMSYDIDNKAIGLKDLKEWAIAVIKEHSKPLEDRGNGTYECPRHKGMLSATNYCRYCRELMIFLMDRFEIKESEI